MHVSTTSNKACVPGINFLPVPDLNHSDLNHSEKSTRDWQLS